MRGDNCTHPLSLWSYSYREAVKSVEVKSKRGSERRCKFGFLKEINTFLSQTSTWGIAYQLCLYSIVLDLQQFVPTPGTFRGGSTFLSWRRPQSARFYRLFLERANKLIFTRDKNAFDGGPPHINILLVHTTKKFSRYRTTTGSLKQLTMSFCMLVQTRLTRKRNRVPNDGFNTKIYF